MQHIFWLQLAGVGDKKRGAEGAVVCKEGPHLGVGGAHEALGVVGGLELAGHLQGRHQKSHRIERPAVRSSTKVIGQLLAAPAGTLHLAAVEHRLQRWAVGVDHPLAALLLAEPQLFD